MLLFQEVSIKPFQVEILQSNATASVRSDVINLCSVAPGINYTDVCSAVSEQFYDVHKVTSNRKVCVAVCSNRKFFLSLFN